MASPSRAGSGYVLGFDFGTSAVKAALFDERLTLVATAVEAYPLELPAPGLAQQDPALWWSAMGAASRRALQLGGVAPGQVQALGMAAQMCGTVPVDASGQPLHPCLIWLDTRSQAQARRLTAGGPRVAGYGLWRLLHWLWLTNGAPNLAGKDPTSKMRWFREERPDIWERTHKLLDVKDWLVHRCTGEFTTSEDLAHLSWMMDNRGGTRAWSPVLAAHVGVPLERLPRIVPASQVAGLLTPQAAEHLGLQAGTPVASGVGDINAYALAAGDARPGAWHLHIGSSSWVATHSEGRKVDPFTGIATICAALPGRHLLVATQESAGAAAAWAAQTLGWGGGPEGLQALDADAQRCTPGSATPLFAPWLHGERVPVDDAAVRGLLAGASLSTSRADLAYAVLAGVALNAGWAWSCAGKLVPHGSEPLRMLGGAAQSAVWPRIVADMLQHPVAVMEDGTWGGSRGAAMTAAVAAQWHPGLPEAMGSARVLRVHEPSPSLAAWAGERHQLLLALYKATRGWHRRLQATREAS